MFHFTLSVPIDRPVVVGLNQGAHEKDNPRVPQFTQPDIRFRILEYSLVGINNFKKHLFDLRNFIGIADTKLHIHLAHTLLNHIANEITSDLAIRNDQHLIVEGQDHGRY